MTIEDNNPLRYCLADFRSVIGVEGHDRRDFLQNLITNDIDLADGKNGIYAFLLTPQGKFLHDFVIFNDAANGRYLLLCEKARREDLLRRLGLYRLRAKVTLTDLSAAFGLYLQWGDGASDGLADPRHQNLGRWIMLERQDGPPAIGGQLSGWPDYNRHRIKLGVPEGSLDMESERSTLLDFGIDRLNGISWTKGCYTGQEVTARMNYRSLVRRCLVIVESAKGGVLPPKGTDIHSADDQLLGTIRSSEGNIGLALVHADRLVSTAFSCGDGLILRKI